LTEKPGQNAEERKGRRLGRLVRERNLTFGLEIDLMEAVTKICRPSPSTHGSRRGCPVSQRERELSLVMVQT
jgi:hypothetical protein